MPYINTFAQCGVRTCATHGDVGILSHWAVRRRGKSQQSGGGGGSAGGGVSNIGSSHLQGSGVPVSPTLHPLSAAGQPPASASLSAEGGQGQTRAHVGQGSFVSPFQSSPGGGGELHWAAGNRDGEGDQLGGSLSPFNAVNQAAGVQTSLLSLRGSVGGSACGGSEGVMSGGLGWTGSQSLLNMSDALLSMDMSRASTEQVKRWLRGSLTGAIPD